MIKIYGKNSLYEALKKINVIEKAFILDSVLKKEEKLVAHIKDKVKNVEIVNKGKMDSLFGDTHQGFGAFRMDYKIYTLEDIISLEKKNLRFLILDGINDPHNFGAILRSVDAFSFDAVILPNNRSVSITQTVAHVSTGAIEHVRIVFVNNLVQAIQTLKENDIWIISTDALATSKMNEIDLNRNLAIIIGSEGFGVSKLVQKQADYTIKIEMTGNVNSLNASVSAGIIMHEFSKK